MNHVSKPNYHKSISYPYGNDVHTETTKLNHGKRCFNCAGEYPHSSECPARGKICKSCGKENHFETVCRSKKDKIVQMVASHSNYYDDEDDYFKVWSVRTGKSLSFFFLFRFFTTFNFFYGTKKMVKRREDVVF